MMNDVKKEKVKHDTRIRRLLQEIFEASKDETEIAKNGAMTVREVLDRISRDLFGCDIIDLKYL